jgi:4-alpha-glucanotransferase
MELTRSYGILLHPTSFAGPFGIGTLGREARRFLDWLQSAKGKYWQVLPLTATGYGDCPYLGVSAWAGNPYLIDPEDLFSRGWLPREEPPAFPDERVEFGEVLPWKWTFLRRAHEGFLRTARPPERQSFEAFREKESAWLSDYALFMSLFERQDRTPWNHWPAALRTREAEALEAAKHENAQAIAFHEWTQWIFFEQWTELRRYAKDRGILIIGDIPIFVAFNSVEVWAHQESFFLDKEGHPTVVGGVPPDYFSKTGQRWGNPLFRWEILRQNGFAWWIERVRMTLRTSDLVRIDHFRGFEAYWEIPASEPTAVAGRWVKAPGAELFQALQQSLGEIPIIAEDLGVINDEVRALRDRFHFPGMKVLQFAFSGDETNDFLPKNYPSDGHCVAYTGTHDNDTSLGWYRTADLPERKMLRATLAEHGLRFKSEEEVPWSLIQLAFLSRAKVVMIPLQDILGLGSEARMNHPAETSGNWAWRAPGDAFKPKLATRLRKLATECNRIIS